jgi:hypothetical protein
VARAQTVHTGGITIDTTGFHELAVALRKTKSKAARDYVKAMREAGEITGARARQIAGEHSNTIAATVKVRVAGAQVSVSGGSKTVAIGGLFELGNKGSRSKTTFRHPLFGNWEYPQIQAMHPYLMPAYVETRTETLAAVDKVLVAAFVESGIKAT